MKDEALGGTEPPLATSTTASGLFNALNHHRHQDHQAPTPSAVTAAEERFAIIIDNTITFLGERSMNPKTLPSFTTCETLSHMERGRLLFRTAPNFDIDSAWSRRNGGADTHNASQRGRRESLGSPHSSRWNSPTSSLAFEKFQHFEEDFDQYGMYLPML